MARPAPDPRACVAVLDAHKFVGLSYAEVVEWTRGNRPPEPELDAILPDWEWEPISRTTAFNYYQQALQWWIENERLSPDEEYAGLRIGLDYAAAEVVREYRAGRLKVRDFVELSVKLAGEIRTLTGAGRGQAELGEVVTVSPRAQAAIDEMTARRDERDRARGRKTIG
jgi:hypothetical protein